MKFSRRIDVAACPMPKIERYLRSRDVHYSRREDLLHGELFRWSELISAPDSDRQSWRAVRVARDDTGLDLEFAYNWTLQAVAQFLLSVFVLVLVVRFGVPKMVAPMLVSANLLFLAASAAFAFFYADRMTRELAQELARPSREAPDPR